MPHFRKNISDDPAEVSEMRPALPTLNRQQRLTWRMYTDTLSPSQSHFSTFLFLCHDISIFLRNLFFLRHIFVSVTLLIDVRAIRSVFQTSRPIIFITQTRGSAAAASGRLLHHQKTSEALRCSLPVSSRNAQDKSDSCSTSSPLPVSHTLSTQAMYELPDTGS